MPDESAYVARTYGDAPNVDGLSFHQHSRRHWCPAISPVCSVTGALEYDLIGELAE